MTQGLVSDALRPNARDYITVNLLPPTRITRLIRIGKPSIYLELQREHRLW